MIKLLLVAATFYFVLVHGIRPPIEPKALVIYTIVDPASKEIVRDALTLIRSIRMFGGSMNMATFVACFAVDKDDIFLDNDLISQFTALNATVEFVDQTIKPKPRTLNKFNTFSLFDATRFSYMLWLDADIVIFDDPMPQLMLHSQPGSIECVSDIHSYMKRFPHVNTSTLVNNPSLSVLQMLGDKDEVSSGHCNTGVLFFDYLSLSSFLNMLPIATVALEESNAFQNDRFLDSLIFVAVVNMANIDVIPFVDYSMNYMALFEVDIIEDTPTDRLYMAHFLSHTEFSCFLVTSADQVEGACTCLYANKYIPPNSLIVRKINELMMPDDACMFMAGADRSMNTLPGHGAAQPSSELSSLMHTAVSNAADTSVISVVWPPHIHTAKSSSQANLYRKQIEHPVMATLQLDNLIKRDDQPLVQMCAAEQYFPLTLKVENLPANLNIIVSQSPDDSITIAELLMGNCIYDNNLLDCSITLKEICIPVGSPASIETKMMISIYEDGIQLGASIDVGVLLVLPELASTGMTLYALNPSIGSTRPISLPSAVALPKFLGLRKLNKYGVVMCCDTKAGVDVVLSLIHSWHGQYLHVYVLNVPIPILRKAQHELNHHRDAVLDLFSEHVFEKGKDILVRMIQDAYQDTRQNSAEPHVMVILYKQSVDEVMKASKSFPNTMLSFVYADIHIPFVANVVLFERWFDVLPLGSVFIASQYVSMPFRNFQEIESAKSKYYSRFSTSVDVGSTDNLSSFQLMQAQAVAHSVSVRVRHALLFTHADYQNYGSEMTSWEDITSSWYIIKLLH